jgi:hypothetical protein
MHPYSMNITYRHFLLVPISFLLSACGQFGNLYLPGHGSGYYHQHPFTERPTHIVPASQKTTSTQAKQKTAQKKITQKSSSSTSANPKPTPNNDDTNSTSPY